MSIASVSPSAMGTANRFQNQLDRHGLSLTRTNLKILQVNLGRLCNQTCRHCHVNAGPNRKELMTQETAEICVRFLDQISEIETLDITGGAPEMTPPFRYLVEQARQRGLRVIDRCNLTILSEPGYEDLADFLAQHQVDVVASLPCYTAANVDKQRGDGTFAASISGLLMLNRLGYGETEGKDSQTRHRLDLVYNPLGPSLPPPSANLEKDYRLRLREDFGVVFDHLICITNMPIGRFRSDLRNEGKLDAYLDKLEEAFNLATVPQVMCRNTISVDWQGWLFDCDFNQMLGMPLGGSKLHLRDLEFQTLAEKRIAVDAHCLGCTAGCGSSCGGALA